MMSLIFGKRNICGYAIYVFETDLAQDKDS